MSDFTDRARAEAVRRAHEQIPGDSIPDFVDRGLVIEFGHQMALWAASQEPTDAESIARKSLGDDAVDRLAEHFGVTKGPTELELNAALLAYLTSENLSVGIDPARAEEYAREEAETGAERVREALRAALTAAREARA